MAPPRSLLFSTDFCISCGTVTLDPSTRRVLLVLSRPTQEYLLPKGRKNASEIFGSAAVRETYEETGVRCSLVAHGFPSLAPEADASSTEPIAVQQRVSMGKWKLIFWFVATADSNVPPVHGTQEEYELFDTVWVDAAEAAGKLAREDDAEVVRTVVEKVLGSLV